MGGLHHVENRPALEPASSRQKLAKECAARRHYTLTACPVTVQHRPGMADPRDLQGTADRAARQVYADFLLERGDPRGEFISLQLARARAGGGGGQTAREGRRLARAVRTGGSVRSRRWSRPDANSGAGFSACRGWPWQNAAAVIRRDQMVHPYLTSTSKFQRGRVDWSTPRDMQSPSRLAHAASTCWMTTRPLHVRRVGSVNAHWFARFEDAAMLQAAATCIWTVHASAGPALRCRRRRTLDHHVKDRLRSHAGSRASRSRPRTGYRYSMRNGSARSRGVACPACGSSRPAPSATGLTSKRAGEGGFYPSFKSSCGSGCEASVNARGHDIAGIRFDRRGRSRSWRSPRALPAVRLAQSHSDVRRMIASLRAPSADVR